MGLKVAMDMGWIVTLVSPRNPTAQISIVQGQPSKTPMSLSIEVADVDASYAKAVEMGIVIVYP